MRRGIIKIVAERKKGSARIQLHCGHWRLFKRIGRQYAACLKCLAGERPIRQT